MVKIVHESFGRVRFKLGSLRDPKVDHRYIRGYLEAVPGVLEARINSQAHSVIVDFDPAQTSAKMLAQTLGNLEMGGVPTVRDTGLLETERDVTPLIGGALLCLTSGILPRPLVGGLTLLNISETLRKGASALLTEGIRTEVLDACAVGLAAVSGEFLTANITQWLLNLAGLVEQSTRRVSDDLVMRLLKPDVETVWIEVEDGDVIEVPYSTVEVGTRVRVQAGEIIPVDGQVFSGQATVNQAAVTGESIPVPRETGDRVLSGSVIEEGSLSIVAERVGDATTTARITSFLRDALAQETVTQSKVDELADKRISITLGAGAITFLLTRSLSRLESVFLVDFSCASKLGTSVAIKAAMAKAARFGGLVKGGQALEKLASADTVVFDKTGTLTHSTLEVTDVVCLDEICKTSQELLALVASIAEHSQHPVAAAVVRAAHSRSLAHMGHEEVNFMIGHGLAATSGDRTVRIGSRHYLEVHEKIDFSPYDDVLTSLLEKGGSSLLYVGVDGRPYGVIALRDRVRDESFEVLKRLRESGVKRIVMITGDNERTARALGERLGIDEVHAEIAPEDKAAIVNTLRDQGYNVAYVGDGVNDAPALMVADVGIAMPRSADVARATADMILIQDSLDGVSDIRKLSSDTMSLIDSNFRLAVGINGALLVGAAVGRIPPVFSALFHNGTTLLVLARAFTGGHFTIDGLKAALSDMTNNGAPQATLSPPKKGTPKGGEKKKKKGKAKKS